MGVPAALAALDAYELRHLPSHLAQGDLHAELHALLALDDSGGNGHANAWFVAKEAIGDGQGYANDIALASAVSAAEADAAIAAGRLAVEVGFEVRYALIRASLTTLTVNLPGEFLVQLVRRGRFIAAHALANARGQPNARARGRALALLSDVAGPAEQRNALEDALAAVAELLPDARDEWEGVNERASVLVVLAERLPADLLKTALARAREIDDSDGRCCSLAALAGRLDGDKRHALLREALLAFDPDRTRRSSESFTLLAENAPGELVPEIVAAAQAIKFPYQRLAALVALIDRLTPEARDTLIDAIGNEPDLGDDQRLELKASCSRYLTPTQLDQLLAAVPSGSWDAVRIAVWAALLPVLAPTQRAEALDAAFAESDAFDPEAGQFTVETAVALLPHLDGDDRRDWLLGIALEALRQTQPDAQHDKFAALAPLLPAGLLDAALEIGRSFGHVEYFWSLQARALIALAQVEPTAVPPEELKRIAARTRAMTSDENREYVVDALVRAGLAKSPRRPRSAEPHTTLPLAARAALRAGGVATMLRGRESAILAQWGETEKRYLLEMLAPQLRRRLGEAAIAVASAGNDHFRRGRLLTQLVPYLDRRGQEEVAGRILALDERAAETFADRIVDLIPADRVAAAIERARAFEDRVQGAGLLATLVQRVDSRDAERIFDDIIDAVEPEQEYRDSLTWCAERFVAQFSPQQVVRIGELARMRTKPDQRFDTLAALLPRRLGDARTEAFVELLRTARHISSFSDRRDRLAQIAPELTALPRARLFALWHEMVGELAERRREQLLADIAGLAPVVAALGGADGVREAARAIIDIASWWP
jgi:hypothetical protein